MDTLLKDVRYALRRLRKTPGFSAIVLLTLALGIGANTAIFSVVNAVLLKPLPFPEPDQLIAIGMTDTRQKGETNLNSLSYPDYFDFRDQNRTLTSEEGATSLRGVKASAQFFDVLGIKPKMGRGFVADDDEAGGGVRQRPEQDAIHHAEDGGVRADAEREGEDRDDRERGMLDELAEAVADVV